MDTPNAPECPESDLQDTARECAGEYGGAAQGALQGHSLARARVGYSGKLKAGRTGKYGGLGRKVKRALRGIAHGLPHSTAASNASCSRSALESALRSPAGRAYLAKHRERVDAHRVLLAATVPFLDLLRAIETGKRPVRTYIESDADDAGE